MSLPIFKSDSQEMTLMQTQWAQQLNGLLSNPLSNGMLLKEISLSTGNNAVNHKLGRKLQGWVLTRQRALAQIYDAQDTNSMPQLTLSLISDVPTVVDIYVF